MRNRTLVGRIVALPILVGATALPAHAQNAEAEPTPAFCALAGLDLLAALDGSWTINQGPGNLRAASMALPLPAPPPAQVTFRFDPPAHVIDVRSADLAEDMIMFPVAPVQQQAADQLIGGPPAANQSGSVCAWLASPTVIGTNVYFVVGDRAFFKEQVKLKDKCEEMQAVINDPEGKEAQKWAEIVYPGAPDLFGAWAQWYKDSHCAAAQLDNPTLDMEMTLVLRFTSAHSGAGMVYFDGKTDKARFRASAPVTLSR